MIERNPIRDAVRYALTAGVAASFAGVAPQAVAQDEDVAEQGLITVTGSRIQRVDIEGPSPVSVIDREDLEASGDISVAEVLRGSSFNQFGSFRQSSGSSAQSQSTISLRGLGATRTLVLLDGRRVAGSPTFGAGSAQNLNTIPIAAVERIEILRDGASAIYGADAIGGVVNIILRRDYEGVRLSATVGRPTQSGGDENSYGLVGGISSGKGNITFTLDHSEQEKIFNGDRSFSRTGLSPFGFPGSFAVVDNAGGNFTLGTFADPRCPLTLDTDPNFPNSVHNPGTGLCNFNYAATSANEADISRDSFFVNSNYQVTEDINFFGRGQFSRTESFGRYAPAPQAGGAQFLPTMSAMNANNPTIPGNSAIPGGFPIVPCTTQVDTVTPCNDYSQFDTDGDGIADVVAPGANTGFDLSLFYRNVPGGFRDSSVDTTLYDYLAGFEGSLDWFGGMEWEIAGQYSKQSNDDTSGGLAFRSFTQAAIDDGTFDILGVNGPTDPAVAATFGHEGFHNEETRIASVDGTVTFDVAQLPNGPLPVAVGFEYRDEKFSQNYDAQQNAGNVDGSAGGQDVSGARSVLAIFGEMQIPILDNLEANLAVRYDSYNDFGTTINPKVSLGYRPFDSVLLRASYGEGFRAPSMSQLYSSPSQSFNNAIDSTLCSMDPLDTDGDGRANSTPPPGNPCLSTQFQNFTGGNVNLDAELSDNLNLGVVWNPMDDLSLSFDWYDIEMEDQISTLPLQTILDVELSNGGSSLVTRSPTSGNVLSILANNQNIAGTRTQGFDVDARYGFSAGGIGDFDLQVQGSKVNNFVRDNGDGNGYIRLSGTFDPEWRASTALNWALGDFSGSLIGNFMKTATNGTTGELSSWYIWDLQFGWATPWNGKVSVGARNLFDEDPPTSTQIGNPNYSNQLHDVYGRVPYIRYEQDL